MDEENKKLEEILKKHEENIKESIGEDIKRHIDVMLESMNDRFDAFAEGQQIIKTDLNSVKEDVELLKEDMDYVKSNIVEMKGDIRKIDAKLDKKADGEVVEDHKVRISKLENLVLAKA
ncbi:TPA: hypothetical protein DCL22_03690 [Candidatus Moranbacteria bacterium]|nr:hypothetical protein [Candidatus Moranbacteria bacterium]